MGDRIVVPIDPLVIPASLQSPHDAETQLLSSSQIADICTSDVHVVVVAGFETSDDEHLAQKVECRICQEEDSLDNMDTPCACRGTIKNASLLTGDVFNDGAMNRETQFVRSAVSHTNPDTGPIILKLLQILSGKTGWTISHATLDLHDPQTLAIAALEHHALEAEHDDYVYSSMSGIGFFQFICLILITLLILRHVASLINADVEKALAYFSFILFLAAAFVLPFYLMARTIRLILTRRQRQLAAAELEFMLPAGQHHGLQFATSPVPAFRL